MDDEQSSDQPDNNPSDDESSSQRALESAARYLAECAAANGENHGGRTPFAASFAALLHWAEANKLIRAERDFPFFQYPPTGYGDEHEGWFDEPSNRWYKATYPNRFGVAWGRNDSATAGEYLNRLVLQNKHFGDDIQLVALVNCGGKLRVLTTQPHIVGNAAKYDEIAFWLRELGFSPFESNGSIAWYREADNLLVSDVHEGNVIRSVTGALFAIDLNLIEPSEAMREAVIELLKTQ